MDDEARMLQLLHRANFRLTLVTLLAVIRSQLLEYLIVGQHVPDRREDRVLDSHQRPAAAAARIESSKPCGQERVLLPGRTQGRGAQRGLQIGIPTPGVRGLAASGRFVLPRADPRPRGQMRRIGKHAHVHSDLGNDHLRGRVRKPRDRRNRQSRFPKRGHRLHDLRIKFADHFLQAIGLFQEQTHHEFVMLSETAFQRINEIRDFVALKS